MVMTDALCCANAVEDDEPAVSSSQRKHSAGADMSFGSKIAAYVAQALSKDPYRYLEERRSMTW